MGDKPKLVAFGICFVHERTFAFNPDTVITVPIDPATGLPPDMGGDAGRAISRPICDVCIGKINPMRIKRGLDAIAPAGDQGS